MRTLLTSLLVLTWLVPSVMAQEHDGLYLITRRHWDIPDPNAGLWAKRVTRLADRSILGLFQRAWRELPALPEDWAESEDPNPVALWWRKNLGEDYPFMLVGLAEAIHEEEIPAPQTEQELIEILREFMWWSPFPTNARLTHSSLRVQSDGETVFFLVTAEEVRRSPQIWSFPVWTKPELPVGGESQRAVSLRADVPTLLPGGTGAGWVYASAAGVEGTSLDELFDRSSRGTGVLWSGVRVPGLAEHLRTVVPVDGDRSRWPDEWLNLRSCLGPKDDLARAWRTFASQVAPFYPIDGRDRDTHVGPHPAAHRAYLARSSEGQREPPRAVQVSEHVLAIPTLGSTDPTVIFDDVWARRHPNLAESIMRWNARWDPLHAEWEEDQRTRLKSVTEMLAFGEREPFAKLDGAPSFMSVSLDQKRLHVGVDRTVRVYDVESARLLSAHELGHESAGILTGDGKEIWSLDTVVDDDGPRLWISKNGFDGPWEQNRLGAEARQSEKPMGIGMLAQNVAVLGGDGTLVLIDGRTMKHWRTVRTGLEGARGLSFYGPAVATCHDGRMVTVEVREDLVVGRSVGFSGKPVRIAEGKGFTWVADATGQIDRIRSGKAPEIVVESVSDTPWPEQRAGEAPDVFQKRQFAAVKAAKCVWKVDGKVCSDGDLVDLLEKMWKDPANGARDLSGEFYPPWIRFKTMGAHNYFAFQQRCAEITDRLPAEARVDYDMESLNRMWK